MSNLNFESILNAIDILLDKKLADLPYSTRAEGKILESLGSGKYRVEYEGGEIEAVDLNPNTSHEFDEGVYLLISNGTQSGIETCILGSIDAENRTDEDISYIFRTLDLEFITDDLMTKSSDTINVSQNFEVTATLERFYADINTTIQQVFKTTGRFIFSLEIQTDLSGINIMTGEYGFRFCYGVNSGNYKYIDIDSKYFTGDPKHYLVPTKQTLSFTIPDEDRDNEYSYFELKYFTKKFKESSGLIKLSNMAFYGASDPAAMKDAKVVITAPVANKSSFGANGNQTDETVALKATLEYEGRTYNPFGATYYWERLNSPTLNGGTWVSLNESIQKNYNSTNYTEIVGRISDEIEVAAETAKYFENYYRCIVKYAGFTKVSEPFKVMDYKKPDFTVSYTCVDNKNTNLSKDTLFSETEEIKITVNMSYLKTVSGYGQQITWFKNGSQIMNSALPTEPLYSNNYIVTYSTTDPIGENIYKCVCGAIYNGEVVSTKEVEIRIYNYTFPKEEDELISEITETIYKVSATTSPPALPTEERYEEIINRDLWNFSLVRTSSLNQFLFSAQRKVLVKTTSVGYEWLGYYPKTENSPAPFYKRTEVTINGKTIIYYYKDGQGNEGDYIKDPNLTNIPSDWSAQECVDVHDGSGSDGNVQLAAQVNIFNQLTQNGSEDGFYWDNNGVNRYEETADATPVAGKNYYEKRGQEYELVKKLTSFDPLKTYYEYINSHLFINATYIKTKTLDISDKFYASVYKNKVSIGGFQVDANGIYSNNYTNPNGAQGIKLGSGGSGDYYIWTPNLKVKTNGEVNINATTFTIGGKSVTDTKENLVLDSKQDISSTGYSVHEYMLCENWVVGTQYTISIKGNVRNNGFGIWADNRVDSIQQYIPYDTNKQIYTYTFTFEERFLASGVSQNKLYIYNSNWNPNETATIEWVKLEKGDIPTEWIPAIGDRTGFKVDADQGIITLNAGNKIEAYVNSNLGLQIANDEISIGGWSVENGGADSPILFKRTTGENPVTTGMAALNNDDHVVFWAGCQNGLTPWEYGSNYDTVTPFFVTSRGLVHTTNLEATGGVIGGFNIDEKGFIKPGYLSITEESAFFQTANFSLNNDVIIQNSTDANGELCSYIATTGERHFEIKNYGGAGIRFNATAQSETINLTLTISNFYFTYNFVKKIGSGNNSTYLWNPVLNCKYTIKDKAGNLTSLFLDHTISSGFQYEYEQYAPARGYFPSFKIPAGIASGTLSAITKNSGGQAVTVTTGSKSKPTNVVINMVSWDGIRWDASSTMSLVDSTLKSISNNNNVLFSLGSFCPNEDGKYLLGKDGKAWQGIRTSTSAQTDSDRRLKNDIVKITDSYSKFFDNLIPVSYKYINGESGRTHIGFIAQDVETSLSEAGLTTKDFAGFCIGQDENQTYSLRYEEFIALNTDQIQKLKKRVVDQEARITKLENKIKEIKGEI